MTTTPPLFAFDNRYARELDGLFAPWQPAAVPAPRWLRLNHALADELGLDAQALASDTGLAVFAGNQVPDGAQPLAQAYAGHQFGGFSPQLGDGRALLLGEVIDRQGQRRDIALKGSGRTPFSRGGDGKAAVGPVLREYVISEAMHALGLPTTRTLAAVATGETIRRDRALPGAVLTRVAASHIRVGTFQFFAARQDTDKLRRLADHTIARHDPALAGRSDRDLQLLLAVIDRQARLVAQWMGVGFIHGVMNTDNTTVSGETIDYGPCAFLEAYDPATVFSSIDHHGRYAFGNQPGIAHWNLARLAEALLPLLPGDTDAAVAQLTEALDTFGTRFDVHWLAVHRAKLGLEAGADDRDRDDHALATDYLGLLQRHRVDFTLGWRRLSDTLRGQPGALQALFGPAGADDLTVWLAHWRTRLQQQDTADDAVADRMDRHNPIHIPRNHLVEAALQAATDAQDLQPFEQLLAAVTHPWDESAADALYARPARPEQQAGYQTFCGT
ncbi:protein adenylyltransferase SelO [Hydrogenophaga sp. NFH-34]|uniref:protein adenylyltransferase SelO n=1 Tax=Hydrogenophaga sp. NFH-34 TaxID=2744446 RepID=UPI001F1C36FC|nr:YdiU family protein [Hydrogenophaga sp. NFH-34]